MNLSQAIVAYEGRLTAVVESILSQFVLSGTQGNCDNHNVNYGERNHRETGWWNASLLPRRRGRKKCVILVNLLWKKSIEAMTTDLLC